MPGCGAVASERIVGDTETGRAQEAVGLLTSGSGVTLPQWATANRERQGGLAESRTTIGGDPFYREWLCGAGQGCRGRILERLYIDNCLPGIISSACLFHSELQARLVLPLQAYRCLYPLEL